MASAAGVPERFPPIEDVGARETEPLLGRPGDAAQEEGVPMIRNLVLGKPQQLHSHQVVNANHVVYQELA